jgi:hypothetical protein
VRGQSLVFYGLPRAAWVDAAVARGACFRPAGAEFQRLEIRAGLGACRHGSSELVASKLTSGVVRLRLASCKTLGEAQKASRLAARREQHATMMGAAALLCVMSSLEAVAGSYAMTDSNIRTAVAEWLSDSAAAEAAYGHISTWETSGVTDMSYLFCGSSGYSSYGCNTAAAFFNEDIGAWDTSGVTSMFRMFWRASAFDQDLGWCVDDDVVLNYAFYDTPCYSTSCGVDDRALLRCGSRMGDSSIRTAVAAWLSDSAAAEAKYGHISTWETGGVTDMRMLFCVRQDWMAGTSNSFWWDDCVLSSSSFNEDIGEWDISGVRTMVQMFYEASAFDQDLGWCLDDGVDLTSAFYETPCASTSCGVNNMAAPQCGGTMDDTTIRTAVRAWLSDSAAAEATYGHISTWDTSGVTDMNNLFLADDFYTGAASFNDNIGAWDTSGVKRMDGMFEDAEAFNQDISGWQVGNVKTTAFMFYGASVFNQPIGGWSLEALTSMTGMFEDASAFDQDLGWCIDDGVNLAHAFLGTSCDSNACGVGQKDAIGICEPWARPCLITGGPSQCIINSPTIIIAIVLILLAVFGACVHRRKKKDETYAAAARRVLCGCLRCCCFCCRKTEPSSVNSRPDSPAESPSEDSDEEATGPESLETRAAVKAKAAETAELSSFSKKLTSFLFREMEEAPKEEEATIPVAPEAEEEDLTEQPLPPPRRWFSRAEPEPEPEPEEMYNQIAAWYNEPGNAALRASWGAFPDPEDFQTWPGFVAVTNAYLDREAG